MNDEARNNMHMCKEALENAQKLLKEASSQVENGSMREQITNQIKQVDTCALECQKICSGLSQYKTHGMHY